jgi:VanZ family protein
MRFLCQKTARVAGWCLTVVITLLSLVPPRPETTAPHNVEHFAIFAAAGVVFGLGYRRRPILVTIALTIFAGAIELAQILVPGRHARLSDFIVDAFSASAGMTLALFAADMWQQIEDRGSA